MSIRLGATTLLGLAATASAATTNTNLQTAFPASSGTSALAAVQTIAAGASFDGGMIQWDRNPSTCNEQAEGGDSDAVFLLEDGATLSNAIIDVLGPNNGEGVHCLGTCTLNNVYVDLCWGIHYTIWANFSDLGHLVLGHILRKRRRARNAEDKVLQHNGAGTVAVKNFWADTVGKVYRSCGNCDSQYARHSTFDNIYVTGADVVAGVNGNYGDTTYIYDSCVDGSLCWEYEGNDDGDEPTKTASGATGTACTTASIKTSC
ncbi:hypothetical protein G7054_g3657 [Neopestalotiopsis clavispora]|nr:hypothetical protein G7054_g3657 [Neopestalotiopsis clavispora]